MKNLHFFAVFALATLISVTAAAAQSATRQPVSGNTDDGRFHVYVLKSRNGVEATVTDFGATLMSLKAPDREGNIADVVLGYDDAFEYETGNAAFGGTIGRYANRIAKGNFTLNGESYNLATNNPPNHLHGGTKGFHKVLWQTASADEHTVVFAYTSKDDEEGYPGELKVQVKYTLTDDNELRIDYSAVTNKETVVNLTNHAYFNLSGDFKRDVLQHQLTLYASRFTPVDSSLIPTGELRSVKNTPFDFMTGMAIGSRIGHDDRQLKLGNGYDHNFVLNEWKPGQLTKAAEVYEPVFGRVLTVYTTEPGVQLYTANGLNGSEKGKEQAYGPRTGFCLETQHFPDSPNRPTFPSTTLKPGQQYKTTTVYRLSTR